MSDQQTQQLTSVDDRLARIDALRAVRRPLLWFVLAMLLFGIISDVLSILDFMLFGDGPSSVPNEIIRNISQLVFAGCCGLFVIQQYRLMPFQGLGRGSQQWDSLWIFWVFLGFAVFSQQGFLHLVPGITQDPAMLLLGLVGDLAIGWHEEIWFRGLLLTLLVLAWRHSRHGHVAAILVSSVLFGLWHLTALPSGADPSYVVPQSIYASFLGVMFAIIFLATGSLWPAIIAHGVFDFGATYFDAVAISSGEPTVFDAVAGGPTLAQALMLHLPFITLSAVVSMIMLVAYMRAESSPLPVK